MAKINLPEDIAKVYAVAPKTAAVFHHCGLGITVDLTKIKMPFAKKLAALEPPVLIAKKKASSK